MSARIWLLSGSPSWRLPIRSFYIILCGGKEGLTAVGDDKCAYRPPGDVGLNDDGSVATLDVQFLDREVYANGAVGGYWEQSDLPTSQPQLAILHNNWIKVSC